MAIPAKFQAPAFNAQAMVLIEPTAVLNAEEGLRRHMLVYPDSGLVGLSTRKDVHGILPKISHSTLVLLWFPMRPEWHMWRRDTEGEWYSHTFLHTL